jgi:hypothetical protein
MLLRILSTRRVAMFTYFISQPLTNFQNVWFNYEPPLLALT